MISNKQVDDAEAVQTQEGRTYDRWRAEQEQAVSGKFVAIWGDTLVGPYATPLEAETAAIDAAPRGTQLYVIQVDAPDQDPVSLF